MEKIIQEKISADHLMYVSLKYTKTADVILNLIKRWTSMIEESMNALLAKAKKQKKLATIPALDSFIQYFFGAERTFFT